MSAEPPCRRSAVSRQACQLICVLSQALGSQFDSLAVQILPALFKVLVITVQVSLFQSMSYLIAQPIRQDEATEMSVLKVAAASHVPFFLWKSLRCCNGTSTLQVFQPLMLTYP